MSTVVPNPASVDIKDILLINEASPLDSLEFATNLFIGNEPSKPDTCVTIFDTPGFAPDKHFDPTDRYYRPSIQIRVRSKDYVTAYTLVNAIKMALHNLHLAINDTVYTAIYCSQEPALLDWDQNGRCRWVCSFDMQRRPGTGITWIGFADKTWENIATW